MYGFTTPSQPLAISMGKKRAQTFAIRCLGSPQTTILYGKSAPYRHNDPNENSITRLRYEVVIRQRLSYLICMYLLTLNVLRLQIYNFFYSLMYVNLINSRHTKSKAGF